MYLNVKLVPVFALLLFGRPVAMSSWLSAAAALLGTSLVLGDRAGGLPPNIGDALSLAAAAASAMFILRLETFAHESGAKVQRGPPRVAGVGSHTLDGSGPRGELNSNSGACTSVVTTWAAQALGRPPRLSSMNGV